MFNTDEVVGMSDVRLYYEAHPCTIVVGLSLPNCFISFRRSRDPLELSKPIEIRSVPFSVPNLDKIRHDQELPE